MSPSEILTAGGFDEGSATVFILDNCLFSQQGQSYVSQRTEPGDVILFDKAPAECADDIHLVQAGQCNSTGGAEYITEALELNDPQLLNEWLLCQM